MKDPNFIDEKTGEKFSIPNFSIGYKDGESIYKDKWGKEIVNPETGDKLVPIPKEGMPAVFQSAEDRMHRNQKYFKDRAKKHAQSDESKHLKQKVQDKEMSSLGFEKTKKKK